MSVEDKSILQVIRVAAHQVVGRRHDQDEPPTGIDTWKLAEAVGPVVTGGDQFELRRRTIVQVDVDQPIRIERQQARIRSEHDPASIIAYVNGPALSKCRHVRFDTFKLPGRSIDDDAWQLVTAPEVGTRLATYAAREEARLSPAALEALAVVAYRQPCTRGDVERVRGVDSDYVIRSLLHRRLVAEIGRRDTPGRPILFGTTFTFLERFGLTSLDDLPPLSSDAAQLTALVEPADGA
jgi:hypothetical protein